MVTCQKDWVGLAPPVWLCNILHVVCSYTREQDVETKQIKVLT